MLRAAVIGVGYLGNFHAQKYKYLAQDLKWNLKLAGVCDSNKQLAEKRAQDLGVDLFFRFQDLIGNVDLVTIATTSETHFEIAKFFLENGVHVNVEKPICLNSSEARYLVDLAKKKGLCLSVGHSERFNPAFLKLKEKIHRPQMIEFYRHAPFNERGSNVSVVHDLMIHDLDLMLSLDNSSVRVMMACGGSFLTKNLDWATAAFEFDSGLKCVISCSRVAVAMTRSIRAFSKEKVAIANLQTGDVEFGSASALASASASGKTLSFETIAAGKGDNLLSETENFVSAVCSKANLIVPGEQGLRALEIAEVVLAAMDSSHLETD